MSEGILESVFGKKKTEPYMLSVSWGSEEVEIPMRTDVGSTEQKEWKKSHKTDFIKKNEKGKDEINSPLYAAQLLKDFSTEPTFQGADINELAIELERNMTEGDITIIIEWWNIINGMTNERIAALMKSSDFLQSR